MPIKFAPYHNKEAVLQALREGATVEECAKKFGLSLRTVWRYLSELREQKAVCVAKKTHQGDIEIALRLDSTELHFTQRFELNDYKILGEVAIDVLQWLIAALQVDIDKGE